MPWSLPDALQTSAVAARAFAIAKAFAEGDARGRPPARRAGGGPPGPHETKATRRKPCAETAAAPWSLACTLGAHGQHRKPLVDVRREGCAEPRDRRAFAAWAELVLERSCRAGVRYLRHRRRRHVARLRGRRARRAQRALCCASRDRDRCRGPRSRGALRPDACPLRSRRKLGHPHRSARESSSARAPGRPCPGLSDSCWWEPWRSASASRSCACPPRASRRCARSSRCSRWRTASPRPPSASRSTTPWPPGPCTRRPEYRRRDSNPHALSDGGF